MTNFSIFTINQKAMMSQHHSFSNIHIKPNLIMNTSSKVQKEIWKDIPNYENLYQASNLGRIKSLSRLILRKDGNSRISKDRIIKNNINKKNNYSYVSLCCNGIKKSYTVHQLVAMTFLGHVPCKFGLVVDHIDNNPLNNSLCNLQIITNRKNCSKDKWRINTVSKYLGVTKDKNRKGYKARIKINGITKHIGSFKTELQAHQAYQNILKVITS